MEKEKTKLKTLKDILGNEMWRNEVKAEAIKWVKNCGFECTWDDCCIACSRTIEMNNITEEDLEEKGE